MNAIMLDNDNYCKFYYCYLKYAKYMVGIV